uniref:Proton-coupled zinc antiporter SLC30A8 n=1 Tax=Labrus bergylta TaxID=56723 RepID=A0A3Q3GMB9_9LABR
MFCLCCVYCSTTVLTHVLIFHFFSCLCASSVAYQEPSKMKGACGIKHCHDNSHSQADREGEKKHARMRLYLVSVICLIFMIGEIIDLGCTAVSFTIWLVTGVLVYLAVDRVINDNYTIEAQLFSYSWKCFVLLPKSMALTLHQSGHGHSHGGLSSHGAQQANASLRAAFVHVVGDLLQSISVLVSMCSCFFQPEYKIADPICTFLFSIFVLCTTFTIMRILSLSFTLFFSVTQVLQLVKGVTAVHNLNIWALTMNQALLSAHVAISADAQTVQREITQACFSSYNFHSVTIQMERQSDQKPDCKLCEDPKM